MLDRVHASDGDAKLDIRKEHTPVFHKVQPSASHWTA